MKHLLESVQRIPEMAQGFYQQYLMEILQHMFAIITDSAHYAGLNMQSAIIGHIYHIVETGAVTVPLSPTEPGKSNAVYVLEFTGAFLHSAFPHLQAAQLQVIAQGFFLL